MARRDAQPNDALPADSSRGNAAPLGLDGFVAPDDEGLSLEELGQAYAALLSKGADPYPQPGDDPPAETADQPAEAIAVAEELLRVIDGGDDACCEITPRSILEATLFVGHPTGEPLTSERIAALMRGVRPAEIDDLVRELNEQYEAAGAPYAILSVGTGYQMAVRPEFASLRDHFYGRIKEARLSQQAIDILAIVAYQQPITAEQIDRLRGKPSGALLSQLVRRDLLRIDRPAEKKAKPNYLTTERFLDLFDLESLEGLPQSQEIERQL